MRDLRLGYWSLYRIGKLVDSLDKILIGEVDVYGTCDYYVGPISVGMHGQVTSVGIMGKPGADAIGSTTGRIRLNG